MVSDKAPDARWRHDLKNQLGIVLGYAELLLQELDQSSPLRDDVDQILNAAQQAMTLLARIEPAD